MLSMAEQSITSLSAIFFLSNPLFFWKMARQETSTNKDSMLPSWRIEDGKSSRFNGIAVSLVSVLYQFFDDFGIHSSCQTSKHSGSSCDHNVLHEGKYDIDVTFSK